MRYSLYWIPSYTTSFGCLGSDWLTQGSLFASYVYKNHKHLNFLDYEKAFKIPKKYGFHAQIFPPFKLLEQACENDVFNILQKVTKIQPQYDIRLRLAQEGGTIFLEVTHTIAQFLELRQLLTKELSKIALIEMRPPLISKETNIMSTHDIKNISHDCYEFRMVLSNTTDKSLHDELFLIAQNYWKEILLKPIAFDSISFCYQQKSSYNFTELVRLPLKSIY